MAEADRRNGQLELRFNADRTQAIGTIHPPCVGGVAITTADVLYRLKGMGVNHGIRDQAILKAVHYVAETMMSAANVIVAQGSLPEDGRDALIHYHLPHELLSTPIPHRHDSSNLPDWFRLDRANLVAAGQELATVTPAEPGIVGKSLTMPFQLVSARAGKPPLLAAGPNISVSEDALHYRAGAEGYVHLQADKLQVYAFRLVDGSVSGGAFAFPQGVLIFGGTYQALIQAREMIAIRDTLQESELRTQGDVYVTRAENCQIVAGGNVYVFEALYHCEVTTPKKIIAFGDACLVGGKLHASEGVQAGTVGTADFLCTEIHVGINQWAGLRQREIEQELEACTKNSTRIGQALKPFASLAFHENLPLDKRTLVKTLQAQLAAQEARIKTLHNERRTLMIAAREKLASTVTISQIAYPGVWVNIGKAAMQIESTLEGVEFVETQGGKAVTVRSLRKAA